MPRQTDTVIWTTEVWYQSAFAAARNAAEVIRGNAEMLLANLEKHLPGIDRQQIVQWLAESNRQRLDAVPDLARFPELRGMRDLVEARWRGERDGAGMNDDQWAAHCDRHFFYQRRVLRENLTNQTRSALGRCTYVFFPTSDAGPILANNLDSSPDERFGPPGWPMLNDALIWGGVSSGIFLDELSPQIFPAPMHDLVGRHCRDTDGAVEFLTRYNEFHGPGNSILADRNGSVAMVEKSACRIGVRRSDDGFGFITAMTAEEPAFRAYLDDRRQASLDARGLPSSCGDTLYWAEADHRRELLGELVNEAKFRPTVEGLRQIIQHRSSRGRVAYGGERLADGTACEHTLRTIIWRLGDGQIRWWAKRDDRPSWENPQPNVQLTDVPLWASLQS